MSEKVKEAISSSWFAFALAILVNVAIVSFKFSQIETKVENIEKIMDSKADNAVIQIQLKNIEVMLLEVKTELRQMRREGHLYQ